MEKALEAMDKLFEEYRELATKYANSAMTARGEVAGFVGWMEAAMPHMPDWMKDSAAERVTAARRAVLDLKLDGSPA